MILLEDDGLDGGHLFDGEPRALAPEATSLYAAERDERRLELRPVVDDDGSRPDPVGGLERPVQVSGEDAGLQAVIAAVDPLDGLIEALDSHDRRARTEGLLADQRRVLGDEIENLRSQYGAVARRAVQQGGAGLDRLLDALLDGPRGRVVDQAADVVPVLPGVAEAQ